MEITWLVGDVPHGQILQIEDDGRLRHKRRRQLMLDFVLIGELDAALHQRVHMIEIILLLGRVEDAFHVDFSVADDPHCNPIASTSSSKYIDSFPVRYLRGLWA